MKKFYWMPLLFAIAIQANGSDLESFLKDADSFFKQNVKNGSIAYDRITKDQTEILALYKAVGSMDVSKASGAGKQAFFINAYNVIVIYWVVKHYPLKSPLDNSGFFDKVKHTVAGESMTLNALEIKKLLLAYKDARFHFALACGAKSCPPLASFAFMPDQLDKQLNDRTTFAINNKDWLRVDTSMKKVAVSKIFEWYKNDFTRDGKTIIEWVNQYRKEKIPTSYTVEFYEYNWSLNEL